MISKRVSKFVLGLTMMAVATPQLHAAAPVVGVDANDLNILFATDAAGDLLPSIGLTDSRVPTQGRVFRRQGGLVTPEIFAQVQQAAKANGIGDIGANLDSWRVVGMRYDSCFPKFDPIKDPQGKNCIEQVRLITQPISQNLKTGEDTTMHLLYSVRGFKNKGFTTPVPENGTNIVVNPNTGAKSISFIFNQLLQLKDDAARLGVKTDRTPMGPHPALTNAQSQVQFSQRLAQFILSNLSPEKLMVITYMGIQANATKGQPWIFFGGNVTPKFVPVKNNNSMVMVATPGSWAMAPQPGADDGTHLASVFDNTAQGSNKIGTGGKLVPAPVIPGTKTPNPDTLGALIDQAAGTPGAEAIKDKAVNFTMDPVRTSPDIGDCVSCHLSALRNTHKVNHVVDAQGNASQNQFPFNLTQSGGSAALVNQQLAELDGITAVVELANLPQANGSAWNTRNFGYFKGKPTVAEITALSARTVVAHTNGQTSLAAGAKISNPGVQCSGGGFWRLNQCLQFGDGTLAACAPKSGCR